MSKIFFIGLMLISINPTLAQTDSPNQLYVGYFGETISHPGLNIGLEKKLTGTDRFSSLLTFGLGGYVHQRNNTSLFARLQWGQRLIFKNGLFFEQFVGFGYLHQFTHGGDIFDVLPNGSIIEKKKTGQPRFMPSISLGTGYQLKNSGHFLYFRPEFFWKAPFNGYYLTHFAINTGIIFKL